MKKRRAFSFWLLVMMCLSPLWAQEVEIKIDHPETVQAGESFQVTVTIQKGSLSDYSRFSQDLPNGLTATNVSSPNADFSFDNHRVRIIWLKLPDQAEVKVQYDIQVNERLKGSFILGGVFAYVVEEERKFLNFEKSREITIRPNPSVDPSLVVDIKDFKEEAAPAETPQASETFAMVVRQPPELLDNGGYLVRLLVKNPEGSKYAKIEETVPSGYLFEDVDSHDGIVSFAGSVIKFIWMKLPETPEFEVVYRLVPQQGVPQAAMEVEGLLTYTLDNQNQVVPVKEVDVVLDQLSALQKRQLLERGDVPDGASAQSTGMPAEEPAEKPATTPVTQPAGTSAQAESGRQQTQSRETAAGSQTASTPRSTATTPRETTATTSGQTSQARPAGQGASGSQTASTPAAAGDREIMRTRVLAEGNGTYFRVQLAANRAAFNARSYYNKAGVDQEVLVEQHQGLYKYTAGSFASYEQAKAYRDRLEGLPLVKGSFVVAYRNGARIQMATALR
ncbi:MAG: hypothetical protein R2751_02445 [Bacteroidales bacterium]